MKLIASKHIFGYIGIESQGALSQLNVRTHVNTFAYVFVH